MRQYELVKLLEVGVVGYSARAGLQVRRATAVNRVRVADLHVGLLQYVLGYLAKPVVLLVDLIDDRYTVEVAGLPEASPTPELGVQDRREVGRAELRGQGDRQIVEVQLDLLALLDAQVIHDLQHAAHRVAGSAALYPLFERKNCTLDRFVGSVQDLEYIRVILEVIHWKTSASAYQLHDRKETFCIATSASILYICKISVEWLRGCLGYFCGFPEKLDNCIFYVFEKIRF